MWWLLLFVPTVVAVVAIVEAGFIFWVLCGVARGTFEPDAGE